MKKRRDKANEPGGMSFYAEVYAAALAAPPTQGSASSPSDPRVRACVRPGGHPRTGAGRAILTRLSIYTEASVLSEKLCYCPPTGIRRSCNTRRGGLESSVFQPSSAGSRAGRAHMRHRLRTAGGRAGRSTGDRKRVSGPPG